MLYPKFKEFKFVNILYLNDPKYNYTPSLLVSGEKPQTKVIMSSKKVKIKTMRPQYAATIKSTKAKITEKTSRQ